MASNLGRVLIAAATASLAFSPAALCADQAAPAEAAKAGQDQCFYVRNINGFSAPDDHTVYVRVGVKSVYRLDLIKDCLDLTWRQSLGLEVTPPGNWVCGPLDATIVYRQTGIPDRCQVTNIHRLSSDEVAALPKKDAP